MWLFTGDRAQALALLTAVNSEGMGRGLGGEGAADKKQGTG